VVVVAERDATIVANTIVLLRPSAACLAAWAIGPKLALRVTPAGRFAALATRLALPTQVILTIARLVSDHLGISLGVHSKIRQTQLDGVCNG